MPKDVQYALVLLKEVRSGYGDVVSLQSVADKHKISVLFLEQVGRRLRVAGYLVSVRGPGGGYVLKKKDLALTLKDVYDAVGRGSDVDDMLPSCIGHHKEVVEHMGTVNVL